MKRWSSWILVGALSMGLGACVSTPPNPLSIDEVNQLRITSFEVEVPPTANVNYPGVSRSERVAADAEAEEAAQEQLDADALEFRGLTTRAERVARLERVMVEELRKQFRNRPNGDREVTLRATVLSIALDGFGQTILIGGSDTIAGSFDIYDPATGQVLATYGGISGYRDRQGLIGAALDAAIGIQRDRQMAWRFAQAARYRLLRDRDAPSRLDQEDEIYD